MYCAIVPCNRDDYTAACKNNEEIPEKYPRMFHEGDDNSIVRMFSGNDIVRFVVYELLFLVSSSL